MDTPQVLLERYLKATTLTKRWCLSTGSDEQCANEDTTFEVFLLRLVESGMMDRERRADAASGDRRAAVWCRPCYDTVDFLHAI
jgi:hypothetical protein